MKGLFTQDIIWLTRQKTLVLMCVFLFVLYTGMGMIDFGISFIPIFLCMVLARTVIYDLQPQVSRFLFTLPFSRKQYIAEKYLISLIFPALLALLLGLAGWCILKDAWECAIVFWVILVVIIMTALFIPFMIRFREKGVLIMALTACIILLIVMNTGSLFHFSLNGLELLEVVNSGWFLPACYAVGFVFLGISAWISYGLIKNEEF